MIREFFSGLDRSVGWLLEAAAFVASLLVVGLMLFLVLARYVRRGGLDISPWRATPGLTPPTPLRLARQ